MFRAVGPDSGHPVAVKAFHLDLTPELADELADALQQLVEAGLTHPGIVAPLAAGCEGSVPYLAQDYVAAESLDVAMRHYAPAAAERAVPLLHHLAGAIDAAHEAGVLHGSLHLRDVFVSPDEARATGFGVARALEDVGLRAPVRRPYAAPEVVVGGDWGPEVDRYAAAAIAYELLTGRRATGSGDEIIERLGSVYVGDEGALPALRDVFAWGLSEDPADRPGRSVEFVTALAEALGVELIEPQPVAAPAPGEPVGVPPPLRSPGAPETEAGVGVGAGLAALAPHDAPDDAPALEDDAAAVDDAAAMDQDEDDDHVGEWSASTAAGSGWDAAAVPPSAAAPTDDLAPLDDLEPIEDEEPLSFSGRVRAGLQVAAAVVVGVVLAGTVYFLFRADVGVGGGDAVAPMEGGALAELPVSDSAAAAPSDLRTAGGGRSPAPRAVSPAPGDETDSDPASREPVGREPAGRGPASEDVRAPASVPAQGPQAEPPSAPEVETAPVGAAAGSIRGEEPASPQVGWLLVRTSPPGATVTVEGVDRGRTPLSLRDVPYGVHRVEIQAPGYEPQTREVTVSAEATVAAIRVELAPGSGQQATAAPPPEQAERSPLPVPVAADPAVAADGTVGSVLVESRPPGARVVIDGEPAGTTPIVVTDLPPGRREVRIERDGYTPWVTVVEVPALDRLRVAASLDRARP
ncbi:MAG: PEGA domain-containing protein [Acidobacteria bacterium]|nr:PEGA domain-containing protein [Acidobacteriota bacterium]